MESDVRDVADRCARGLALPIGSAKHTRIVEAVQEMSDARQKKLDEWTEAQQALDDDMDQVLGKALGYPELYPDASEVDDGTVCTAPHLPVTLAHEAADKIKELKREIEYLRQYGNKDCTAMADDAMEAGEMDEKENDQHRDQPGPTEADRESAPNPSE